MAKRKPKPTTTTPTATTGSDWPDPPPRDYESENRVLRAEIERLLAALKLHELREDIRHRIGTRRNMEERLATEVYHLTNQINEQQRLRLKLADRVIALEQAVEKLTKGGA